MDNRKQTAGSGNSTPEQVAGKTFSQEQVNTIVQERVAREKARITKMEQLLARRELEALAVALLQDHGLPLDLMPAIRMDTEVELVRSVDTIVKVMTLEKKYPRLEDFDCKGDAMLEGFCNAYPRPIYAEEVE